MSLPIFNQPYAIDFHPTDFRGFKATPVVVAFDVFTLGLAVRDGVKSDTFSAYVFKARMKKKQNNSLIS